VLQNVYPLKTTAFASSSGSLGKNRFVNESVDTCCFENLERSCNSLCLFYLFGTTFWRHPFFHTGHESRFSVSNFVKKGAFKKREKDGINPSDVDDMSPDGQKRLSFHPFA
jgi:hypothetical protein